MKAKIQYSLNLILILSMTLVMAASPAIAGDSSGAGVQSASAAPVLQEDTSAKIEAELVEAFSTGAEDYIVRFSEQADLSAANRLDWNARGEYVYNTLLETAERSQKLAKQSLSTAGLSYQTFIAGNELYVWGGSLDSALTLAALPEVEFIRQPRVYHIDPVIQGDSLSVSEREITWVGDLLSYPYGPQPSIMSQASPQAIFDWGILDVQADQFWSTFGIHGEGILVANIDTGVQWDHPALVNQYKCGSDPTDTSCWSDPSNICGGSACDNNGHGTHTMGTMVADDDPDLLYTAGMAPSAQWIACKGCENSSCSEFALNSCADWILAPGGDTGNRPHVVNNSWGGGGGDDWYLSKVEAWRAAGIFPAFSAGNSGPSCSTLGSPGDYQESFSTANHNSSRLISSSSSRGPSAFGHDPYTKPNISAPGSSICSTVPGSSWNCGYSGTSMASPHTAGAVALLWSCNPGLVGQIDQTFQILQDTADAAPAGTCGAPPDGEGNYTYGYGFLNVYNSGIQWCGAAGSLQGTVTNELTSDPVPQAHIYTDPGSFESETDGSGFYDLTLPVGDYTVYAEAFGYLPASAAVTVVTDTITTQDFVLTPAATSPVTGVVYDVVTGWPLYSRIDVAGVPGSPFWSDPQTGEYAIDLPTGGTYDFHVEAWVPGYIPSDASIVVAGPVTRDFPLNVNTTTCTAPGYTNVPPCTPPASGGLVVGNVYDQNSLAGLNGAEVNNDGGFTTTTLATPDDPDVDDGFFTIFSPLTAGAINHYASKTGGYGVDLRAVLVLDGGTVTQDFYLPAGWLDSDPDSLAVTLNWGDTASLPLNLANMGAMQLDFYLRERDHGMQPVQQSSASPPANAQVAIARLADGSVDCAAYENSIFAEPLEVAQTCHDYVPKEAGKGSALPLAPTDMGFAHDIGFVSDNVVEFTLNNFPGQAVLSSSSLAIFGYDYSNDLSMLYALRDDTDEFGTFDRYSGSFAPIGLSVPNGSENWTGLTVDPASGTVYASATVCGANSSLYTISPATGEATYVGDMSGATCVIAIAMGPAGDMYAHDIVSDAIYQVDPSTGAATLVGLTGYNANFAQGMDFDNDDGSLYIFLYQGGGANIFGTVDLTTGAVTPLSVDNPLGEFEGAIQIPGSGYDVPWLSEDPITGTLSGNMVTPPLTASSGEQLAVVDGPAQEVVGDEAPEAEAVPSALGLSSAPRTLSAVLWDNGPLVTNPGAGYGGADLSALQTSLGMNTYGFGHQYSFGYRVADGFEVTAAEGWLVETITFYAYQTGSSLISPMTGVYLQIWDGPPNDPGSSVVWGDLSTNRLVNTAWSGIYRALATSPLDNARPIMANTLEVGTVLPPGSYWLDWTTSGGLSSGPWAPPISILGQTTTGDGLQYTDAWAAVTDTGTGTQQGFPFVVEGTLFNPQTVVDVTFDASVPEVDQPGDYHATLVVGNDTPYGSLDVPVTMTVLPPADWGKLEGTVTGLGYCDDDPAPLEGAQVVIEGSLATYTVTTDASGHYQWWLDEGNTPLDITVSYPEHTQGVASGVEVSGGATTTQDFDLRWLVPCVSAAPSSFEVEVAVGYSLQRALSLTNAGAAGSAFEISELPDSAVTRLTTQLPASSPEDARLAPDQVGRSEPVRVVAPAEVLVNEGFEGGIMPPAGWTTVINNPSFTWGVSTMQPYSGSYHADIVYDPALVPQDEWIVSPEFALAQGTVSFWSYGSLYWCRDTYDNCDLNLWIVVGDVGGGDDIYVGTADADWPASWTYAQSVFDLTPYLPGGLVRLGFQYEGQDGAEIALDEIVLDGEVVEDVPWLSEDPITGTLEADSTVDIELTFDTMTYTAGTQLMAVLRVESDDPVNDTLELPVTMNVVALAYGVDVSPDMGLSGHPAETITYTVYITSTSNGPNDSFDLTLGSSAFPSTVTPATVGPLAPGEAAMVEVVVEVPSGATSGSSDEVVLTATSQGDPAKSDAVALTTTVAGSYAASFDPAEYSLMGKPGEMITYTLMLSNEGDENTFVLSHSGNAWNVEMPLSDYQLAAGESMPITVMVTIDAEAANGDRDTVTITATGLGGVLASAELTTVAALPKVYLPIIPQAFSEP